MDALLFKTMINTVLITNNYHFTCYPPFLAYFFLVGSFKPAGTVFGSVSEERCAAMRSVEDFAAMGLNQSQADAVNSLVQCPYGVQLVQGPPGWKPLETRSNSVQKLFK